MPQGLGRNLYAPLSVFDNVDFFGRLFDQPARERRRRIDELLASTGLEPFRDRPAGKLSGGMKQKLGLCCALLHDPDVLILDEPTTGIDPLSRRQFWRLLARIRSRRPAMSVLVSTAYMEEAESFDWLAAMDAGRLLASGTPQALMARTGTRDLDAAFIALLPEARRRGHRAFAIPARPARDGEPAIEATRLTRRFGDFIAVDHVSFRIERGEIFGFLGSNGCGKTHDDEDARRPAARHRGPRPALRPRGGSARPGKPAPGRLHVPGLLALRGADRPPESRSARPPLPAAGRVASPRTWPRCSASSTSTRTPTRWPRRCRSASGSACPWPWRWCTSPRS